MNKFGVWQIDLHHTNLPLPLGEVPLKGAERVKSPLSHIFRCASSPRGKAKYQFDKLKFVFSLKL